MKRFIFLLSFLIFPFGIVAKDFRNLGTQSISMANISSVVIDTWATSNNQSLIPFLDSNSVGLFSSYPVNLDELKLHAVALVYNSNLLSYGFCFSRFGFELYNENSLSISLAKMVAKSFSFALAFDYYFHQFGDQRGTNHAYTTHTSFTYFISADNFLSFHGFNLFNTKIGSIKVEPNLRFGLCNTSIRSLKMYAEVEKENKMDPILKLGIAYYVFDQLKILAGSALDPWVYSFGFEYSYRVFKIGASYSFDDLVESKFAFSLSYEF